MQRPNYELRVENLRKKLWDNGCEAFLSVDPMDNAYLTGFFGSTSAVMVTLGTARLLCDFRYAEQASTLDSGVDVAECTGDLDRRLGEHLRDAGVEHAAFDPATITLARFEKIEDAFGRPLSPVAGICRTLREIKEPAETERIQAASQLAEAALEDVLKTLAEGVTEQEIAGLLEYEFRKRGARGASFDTIALFGARSSLPHGVPSGKPLENGDIVLIDCGCVLDGYCSDLTRTFVFGRIPGNWFLEVYECVRQAQEAAVLSVRAGARTRAVDSAARTPITQAGYGNHFGHGTGHGVGLEVHEDPRLNAQSEAVLESGMAVTVEPGIYLPGQGGVRIEDLVTVTEAGCIVLTETSKELRIL